MSDILTQHFLPLSKIGFLLPLHLFGIAIFFYTAVFHFFLWKKQHSHRIHLIFTALCLISVGYVFFTLEEEKTINMNTFLFLDHFRIGFLLLFLPLLGWFFAAYSELKSNTILLVLAAIFSGFLIINFISPTGLLYTNIDALIPKTLPWGETIVIPKAILCARGKLFWFFEFSLLLFCGWCIYRLSRIGKKAGAITISFFIFIFIMLIDFLIDIELIDFPHISELGMLAFVLLMSSNLSSILWQRLEQANNKLETINKKLINVNERLRKLNNLKTEFVSIAAHEIRTPLTSIVGFAKTLQLQEVELSPEDKIKYIRIIESEGKRLGVLVDNILNITRLETEDHALNYKKVNLCKFIREAIMSIKIPKNIRLNINTTETANLEIALDPEKIQQVIINILENALKYNRPNGNITIKTSTIKDAIQVSITDTGPGITKDELPKIFNKFYRGTDTTNNHKGSGLGLSIAKTIIISHNGEIWAESEPGKGSTFYFTVPKLDSTHTNS